MWAAAKGHPSVVEVLIKAGASLDLQDRVGVAYSIELFVVRFYMSPALSAIYRP